VIGRLAFGDVNAAGVHQHDVGCISIEGDRCRLGSSTLVRTPGGVRHRKTGRQPATPPASHGAGTTVHQACECGLYPTRPNTPHCHPLWRTPPLV
jgi:hypothetical protein